MLWPSRTQVLGPRGIADNPPRSVEPLWYRHEATSHARSPHARTHARALHTLTDNDRTCVPRHGLISPALPRGRNYFPDWGAPELYHDKACAWTHALSRTHAQPRLGVHSSARARRRATLRCRNGGNMCVKRSVPCPYLSNVRWNVSSQAPSC